MTPEQNWANRMSLWEKLRFFRDTGEWPGTCGEDSLRMFMEGNIRAEIKDGKIECARRKLARAREAGLKINISEIDEK